MENILVAINYEKNAERLIEEGYRMAQAFDAKVWVLHVTQPDSDDYLSREAGPQYARDKKEANRKKDAALVKGLTENLKSRNIRAEWLVIEGPTAKTIQKKAVELNIDLVIAGHQKKNFFYQMFVGNKDREIIGDLNVPVLVVPLPKKS